MKIGIIGLENSGKTTLFNALTGQDLPTESYPTREAEPTLGVVKVPDPRVEELAAIYEPRKTTFATVEYLDYLGVVQGDPRRNRKVADMVKDVEAVVHVVRGFQDPSVAHPLESVDPRRDAGVVELELVFADLELVEKRLERIDDGRRKGRKPAEGEEEVLVKCRAALEGEVPLRAVGFTEGELRAVQHLQFISAKPELMILNVGEDAAGAGDGGGAAALREAFRLPVLTMPGKIEMEISQLSPDGAELFLKDLGIAGSAMARVIGFCYEHLGLISFLTVGKDEVRAWTVKRGTPALEAAGKIHSDIQKGFIRAEVVACDDFRREGSMAAAREKGLVRLEGKTYEVRDGDIINFRFNV